MNTITRTLSLLLFGLVTQAGLPLRADVAMNPMKDVDVDAYLEKVKLPPGFEISIYARDVTGARSMVLAPNGTLFVGTFAKRGEAPYGKVYAVIDTDGDHRADKVITIARDLNHPNGVAVKDGNLYVAEIDRILRYDGVAANPEKATEPKVIATFPSDFHHGWKFIDFGPDGKLYVPVGAPCNICEPGPEHALIARMDADGSNREVYARGVRNSVGFDWHPETGEMYFTDNGRDEWGNDRPPEELNHAPRPGLHFGFPYRYGKGLVDDTYQTSMKNSDFRDPVVEFPAHNACLGLQFYTGDLFPDRYHQQAFVACHGSWNRQPPDGYRVSLVRFTDNQAVGYEHFASGWLQGEHYWGRPVDIELLADGSMLVSDDFNHVIYRISYTPEEVN